MEGTDMPRTDLNLSAIPSDFESLVRAHPPAAIHDDVAYENAIELVNKLTSLPSPTEGQLKYLDTLTILVERYEDETEGVEPRGVDALAVLRHLMEDRGMNASDLGRLLGNRSLGPKILSGDRALSKAHIKILAKHFNVSPAVLLD
jgi:antitoxin component HigA of HigAB toxin-antitoxin module